PKPEFWHVKKLHSPVHVAEAPLPLPADATVRIPVENRYDFLDLSALRIAWQLGDARGEARAAVPARTRGELAIELPRRPEAGETLALDFTDAHGALIDGYRLRFAGSGPPRAAAPAAAAAVAAAATALQVHTERRLNGSTVTIAGREFELAFG